ncbi:triacylglycerol lipase [Gordonia sp. 852002-10350_SCH5691597]|nr:triacylglycerol lipase [Gordonia sp. 852002-51296_SCH5728562-b]OBA68330.1 triacylglycerol lipase [Gordonia sp. 852002-10350_SCH5691597]
MLNREFMIKTSQFTGESVLRNGFRICPIRSRRIGSTVVTAVSAALLAAALLAPTADAATSVGADPVGSGPVQSNFRAAARFSNPEANPPGANNWACRPSAAHPRPVVLVHGTWESAYQTWAGFAPVLARHGFCVFAPNLGILSATDGGGIPARQHGGEYGAGHVDESSAQLGAFVDRVLRATGARQVDLVGHSQGGVIARGYLKFHGGADASNPQRNKVSHVVTMVATNHGTTMNGLVGLENDLRAVSIDMSSEVGAASGPAGADQEVGSAFITRLNRGGDTLPGIGYTVLTTIYDEVSTPYTASFLTAGPGARVENIVIQNGCADDHTEHTDFTYSPRAQSLALRGLGADAPVVCVAR